MEFTNRSNKNDSVVIYTNESGTMKIINRGNGWELREYSLFNVLGETIGRFDSLQEAIAFVGGEMV